MPETIYIAPLVHYVCDDKQLTGIIEATVSAGLAGVLVHSRDVQFAAAWLAGKPQSVVAAISYPGGVLGVEARKAEMQAAFEDGADAMCIVAPMQAFRDGQIDLTRRILSDAVQVARGRPLFAIIESCLLDDAALSDMVALSGPEITAILPTTGFEGATVRPDPNAELARLTKAGATGAWFGPGPAATKTSIGFMPLRSGDELADLECATGGEI